MSEPLTQHDLTERLVTTLGHSLWQGAAIALALYLILRVLPARLAGARYTLALVALIGMVLACFVTWKVLEPHPARIKEGLTQGLETRDPLPVQNFPSNQPVENSATIVATSPSIDWRTPVLLMWLIGVILGWGRLILAVAGDRRLRGRSHAANESWLGERLAELASRLNVRQRVRVLLNSDLLVPAVCGLIRPVILVPASLIGRVPAAYLEAALAHELAHIRRYDYLINLVQMAVEALLFFNPGVWWISRQIRREREACCDALAMEAVGEPCSYARALTAIAESALVARNGFARTPVIAMSGEPNDEGQLIDRIRRLLRPAQRPGLRLSLPSTLVFLAGSLLVLAVLRLTTNAAVEFMTPRERIEKMAELHREYPVRAIEAARGDQGRREEPLKKVTLSGRIISGDGSPLRDFASIVVAVSSPASEHISTHPANSKGEFRCEIRSGYVVLLAEAEDRAPKYLSLGKVTESQDNLILTLEKGFSSSLQFFSPDRTPLGGVSIRVHTAASPSGRATNWMSEKKSGSDGIIRLEHLTRDEFIIEASLPGYQRASWKKVILEPNETRAMRMDRATVKIGSIMDSVTGVPVAGAEIKRYKERGPGGGRGFGEHGPTVTRSEGNGQFTLDTLEEDIEYHFLVTKPGYLSRLLSYAHPGELAPVRLTPSRTVRVEVRNVRPEHLNRDDELSLSYDYLVTARSLDGQSTDSTRDRKTFTAKPQNGVGQFDVPLVFESETGFYVGSRRFEFEWSEITDGRALYVLDLQTPDKKKEPEIDPATLRRVEIRLNTPVNSPPPAGQLIVTYRKNPNSGTREEATVLVPLADGMARLEVPAPNELKLKVEGLQGYWFGEPHRLEVPLDPRSEVVKLSVDSFPAGAIYGTLHDAEGKPAQGAIIQVHALTGHKVLKGESAYVTVKNSASGNDDSSRFVASPLPLAGKFIISASQRNSRIFSEPLMLDENTPFHRIQLQFPVGETIQGTVLSPDGSPKRNAEVWLSLESNSEGVGSFSNTGAITDRNGKFQIEKVNTALPGKYFVQVEKLKGAQPVRMEAIFGKPMEIRLSAGYSLTGIVKEAVTGRAVPGAQVYAVASESNKSSWPVWIDANAPTDAQGRFYFDQLPAGGYRIRSRSGSLVREGPSVTAGQAEEVTLEVELATGSEN